MSARATTARSRTNVAGLALTWLGGGIAVLLLIPVLGLTSLAWTMSTADVSDSGLFVCHDRTCVSEMTAWTFAGVGATALVVAVVVLVVWSSTPSLVAAAITSSAAFLVVLRFVLHVLELQSYAEVVAAAVVVVLAPAGLAAGSMLRLWARRGS